jgi:hypothetical protein
MTFDQWFMSDPRRSMRAPTIYEHEAWDAAIDEAARKVAAVLGTFKDVATTPESTAAIAEFGVSGLRA